MSEVTTKYDVKFINHYEDFDAIPNLTKHEAGEIASLYAAHPRSVSVDIITYEGYDRVVNNFYRAEDNVIHINPRSYPQ